MGIKILFELSKRYNLPFNQKDIYYDYITSLFSSLINELSETGLIPLHQFHELKGAIILNPLSEKREEEIAKIKETLGAVDRFTVQEAVMPFDLQKEYKRKHERVGVGYD